MKSRIVLMAVLAALLLPAVAFAAKAPPSISEIQGIYQVKMKAQVYDGDVFFKASDTTTVEVSQVGADTVNVYVDYTGTTYRGFYKNGVLVIARGEDEELSLWTDGAVIQFSGTPGKIKIKGVFRRYSLYDYIENVTLSGKWTPGTI